MRKNNKGITMIEVVIVIIILILLAVIAIWNTWSSYNKAEGTNLLNEFKSLEEGAVMLENIYNTNPDFELKEDEHYCTTVSGDVSGEVWYVLYGRDAIGNEWYSRKTDGQEIFRTILSNWGINDLQRSYEIKLDDGIKIRYANGNYVLLNDFKVYTYDDIRSLRESGAF
ncbi:MAG: prepilin-type N-terminal cleavage/methylation domain-containing protein [Clostridia bacterium]|nr:prepilin-type N-terminal cleavage/methylation domain-containing protein [Clostridia bacterium]